MRQEDDLPIEPLSEAAFARVEAAVFAELDAKVRAPTRGARAGSRRLSMALVAAVALALGAALALVFGSLAPAPRRVSDSTLASTRVTASEAATDTVLGDVAIRLERGASLVAVRDGASGSLVLLERGVAHFAVPPRAFRPFVVQAGDVTVEVVGTRFEVSRSEAAVRVHTTEGIVRVVAGDRTTLLRAGATWNSAGSSPPAAPLIDGGPEAAPGATVRGDSEPPAPANPAARASTTVSRPRSSADERERFELASRLEVTDAAAALRIYASLVAHGGRWGETALYAQARLEFELGHRETTVRLLERYLREHPQGTNANDVQTLLARLAASAPRARE